MIMLMEVCVGGVRGVNKPKGIRRGLRLVYLTCAWTHISECQQVSLVWSLVTIYTPLRQWSRCLHEGLTVSPLKQWLDAKRRTKRHLHLPGYLVKLLAITHDTTLSKHLSCIISPIPPCQVVPNYKWRNCNDITNSTYSQVIPNHKWRNSKPKLSDFTNCTLIKTSSPNISLCSISTAQC